MNKRIILFAILSLGVTTEVSAAFITSGAIGSFTETNTNDQSGDLFVITNTWGLGSEIRISSITFDLASNLAFDPSDGSNPNPGSPFEVLTSVPGGTVSSTLSDDLTLLTLNFTDFDPGETFEFAIDVDRTMGGGPGQKQVMGHAFAGTRFTVNFEGPNGSSLTMTSSFAQLAGFRPFEATAGVPDPMDVEETAPIPNPEPSSWILLSLGALGLGYVGLKRRRKEAP